MVEKDKIEAKKGDIEMIESPKESSVVRSKNITPTGMPNF